MTEQMNEWMNKQTGFMQPLKRLDTLDWVYIYFFLLF